MQVEVVVILDYDGTLTAEEDQVEELAHRSLEDLSHQILGVPLAELEAAYRATREMLLAEPHRFFWEVDGNAVSYCDEGAFTLNTVTLQTMLVQNPSYAQAVRVLFQDAEYDPVAACTNYLFHTHTAALVPCFRPETRRVLSQLIAHPQITPLVLTNSLGDKVGRNLDRLGLPEVRILGDTRQYEVDRSWPHRFHHPQQGNIQVLRVDENHWIDLRRRAYYEALVGEAGEGHRLVVVGDTLSLPGALPLMLGIPYFLLKTSYTPAWCEAYVGAHLRGEVLDDLGQLPAKVERLLP